MTGVIILNKPEGFTSFDAIAVVRGMTKQRKIGHTGTLDPMATGVLPLLLGRAAKAADLIEDSSKEYLAGFRIGERRVTGDVTGEIVEESNVRLTRAELEEAAESFVGETEQIPPMYSAVQINGQRLYHLARQGIEVERKPRKISIDRLEITEFDEERQEGTLLVSCSKGTYIRVLIEDIADGCGALATMTSLVRTRACGFELSEAISLSDLQKLCDEERIAEAVRSTSSLFEDEARITLSDAQKKRFLNGAKLSIDRLKHEDLTGLERAAVYTNDGGFLGLAKIKLEENEVKPLKLFVLE